MKRYQIKAGMSPSKYRKSSIFGRGVIECPLSMFNPPFSADPIADPDASAD